MAQRHDWYITIISTGQRYRIEPGESVVIGRTPLRPGSLPPEKAKRLSIPDAQRSMSKRHLLLSLDPQGAATVEDLASTNGTYVVRPDSRLIRLPARRTLQLDESPVRLQLGDIGLELTRHDLPAAVRTETAPAGVPAGVRTEEPSAETPSADASAAGTSAAGTSAAGTSTAGNPSAGTGTHAASAVSPVSPAQGTQESGSDLFAHGAQNEGPSDLAGGVDDIVAAREGEPTDMFDASRVRASVRASKAPDGSAPAGSTGFEPGSVFDRLTRGEMGPKQTPQVVVDGLTSDEARHSADHDKQFQMARHRQLLPFLAANPYLYQELYDWLASIPDPVIAAALDHNPGYHPTTAQN